MATAKITLIGMYNADETLFDGLNLPAEIDKDEFINNLLITAGEFEVVFSDYDFLKFSIGVWSRKWYRTFDKWLEGMKATWNPIENYDRYEEINDTTGRNLENKSNGTNTIKGKNTDKTENKVSAYDSDAYSPESFNENNGSSESENKVISEDKVKEDTIFKHTAHIHGNIGVTQSSEMLVAYLDVAKWSLYDKMTDLFKNELLICIY